MIDSIYVKSMGKLFKVRQLCKTDEEANNYCEKHRDTGVIAVDADSGLIFVADLYQVTIPSNLIP